MNTGSMNGPDSGGMGGGGEKGGGKGGSGFPFNASAVPFSPKTTQGGSNAGSPTALSLALSSSGKMGFEMNQMEAHGGGPGIAGRGHGRNSGPVHNASHGQGTSPGMAMSQSLVPSRGPGGTPNSMVGPGPSRNLNQNMSQMQGPVHGAMGGSAVNPMGPGMGPGMPTGPGGAPIMQGSHPTNHSTSASHADAAPWPIRPLGPRTGACMCEVS
jgi:hypothetical protein